MKKFIFIGGDKRQQYAAQYLMQKGCSVAFADDCPEFEQLISNADYIVLPLPVSRDSTRVNSPLSIAPVPLKRVIRAVEKEQTVFAGMPSEDFADSLKCKGVTLYDYYKNEALTILNSISTAEGVIFEIIGNTNANIHSMKIAVIGYGKAGSAIARRLSALGAEVVVAARSERDRAAALSDNCKAIDLYKFEQIAENCELVVNTVPARVIDEKIIEKLPKSCLMIEVSSAPYGIDFQAAEKHGIRVIRAPSLPGRTAPKSAGEAIAKTILGVVEQ